MRTREDFVRYAAPIVHETLGVWSAANRQPRYPAWEIAPDWMKEATYESVTFVLDHPGSSDSLHHDQWMQKKIEDGWVWGPVKDGDKKTHPMLVAFEDLPIFERKKDALVKALVLELYRQEGEPA